MSESERKGTVFVQYAALPIRHRASAGTEVLLITSRTRRRWIIPKGWPLKGAPPHATARREALEEAGLVGRIGKRVLGSFRYRKRLRRGEAITCEVQVYSLKVARQLSDWEERSEREARWFSPQAAIAAVSEPELKLLMKKLLLEAGGRHLRS